MSFPFGRESNLTPAFPAVFPGSSVAFLFVSGFSFSAPFPASCSFHFSFSAPLRRAAGLLGTVFSEFSFWTSIKLDTSVPCRVSRFPPSPCFSYPGFPFPILFPFPVPFMFPFRLLFREPPVSSGRFLVSFPFGRQSNLTQAFPAVFPGFHRRLAFRIQVFLFQSSSRFLLLC